MKIRKQLTFIMAFAMCCGLGNNLIEEKTQNIPMMVSAVENTGVDWADAYIEYLNNVDVNKLGGFKDTTRFSLAYIDDDNIPELLIIAVDDGDNPTTSVATYYNGEVCVSSGYYGFGYGYSCEFRFTEKDNSILQDWEENEYTIYSIKDGHINVKYNLKGLYPNVVDNYYIDDEVVSEEEFNALKESASRTTISYNDMLPFTCDIQAEVSKYVPKTNAVTTQNSTSNDSHTVIIDSGYCGEGEDENNVLYTLHGDGNLNISGISYIKEFSFNNNDKINSLVVGPTVTGIENGAFKDCTSLEDVKIDSHTTYINSQAFSCCSNLKKINIQSDIKFIDKDAFRGCNSLEDILILDTNFDLFDTYIGYYYDEETSSYVKMSDFTVRGYIGSTAEEYAIANGFKFINVLSDDDIESEVLETGSCGDSCSYVTSYDGHIVTISVQGTGEITDFEFGNLTNEVFNEGSKYDEEDTTVSIRIGEGITSIGNNAFDGLVNRAITLFLPSTLESIGDLAFFTADINTVIIPKSVKYISPTAFLCSAKNFLVDADNTTYTTVDGVLFTKDMKTLVKYPARRSNIELNGYTVPETVTKLYSSSFFMRDMSGRIDNNVSITIPCDADVEILPNSPYYFGHHKYGIQEGSNYDSFTIYGYAGSGIEEYVNITNAEIIADKYYYNDINFVPIKRPNVTTTTTTTQQSDSVNTNVSTTNDGKNTNTSNNSNVSSSKTSSNDLNIKDTSSPSTRDNGLLIPSILTLTTGLIAMFTKKRK